jgi:hypothetical protein
MVWVKIDDSILDNPKIIRSGPVGFALHVAAITWSARNMTDGFIPEAKAKQLLSKTWSEPRPDGQQIIWELHAGSGHVVRCAEDVIDNVIELLVQIGLWHEQTDGYGNPGYELHDFTKFNPTRAEVLAKSELRRTAGRNGGKQTASKHSSKTVANTQANDVAKPEQSEQQNSSPYPVPDPVPIREDDNARTRVVCPDGLELTEPQRASLLTSLVPADTIDSATKTYRAKYAGDTSDLRTVDQWRRGLVTAIGASSNARASPGRPRRESAAAGIVAWAKRESELEAAGGKS